MATGAGKDRRQRLGKTEEIRPVITWFTRTRRTVAFWSFVRSLASVHLIFLLLACVFIPLLFPPVSSHSLVVIFCLMVSTGVSVALLSFSYSSALLLVILYTYSSRHAAEIVYCRAISRQLRSLSKCSIIAITQLDQRYA